MLISFPPEGDQKSPSLRSGFWRANIVGSFLCPHTVLRLDPQAGQARKDKQAMKKVSPLTFIACLSLYGIHGILKTH